MNYKAKGCLQTDLPQGDLVVLCHPLLTRRYSLENSMRQDTHREVRHAGSERRNPIPPQGNSPVFSTKLCRVNKGVREPCLADLYHLKSKARRRQVIKIK